MSSQSSSGEQKHPQKRLQREMCFPQLRAGGSKGLPGLLSLPPCPPSLTWCLCGARLELARLPGFWLGSGVAALSQRFPLVALHLAQPHTSTACLAALWRSREGIMRGRFLFSCGCRVLSSCKAFLWRLFLRRFGSDPTLISDLAPLWLLEESLWKLGQGEGGVGFLLFNAAQSCFCFER